MKILYTNFHPRNGGGHATYVANLAAGLRAEHHITVATPGTSRLYAQVGELGGVERIATRFSTRLAPMWGEVRRLRALLVDRGFDMVHVNGSADHRQMMLARWGLRKAPPIIFTKHNTMALDSAGNWLRARYGTSGAIGVSDYVSGLLRESPFRRVPIRTVHHGVDTDRFRPRSADWVRHERAKWLGQLPEGAQILVSVGGTDRDKGWLYLAQALAALDPAQRERVHLVVAGDPLRGRLLEDFQALGLSRQVHFPGLVDNPEDLLAMADLGFVLSDHEACSFAACESLASGLPTLVSNAGGLPEVVQDGSSGWVVPVGDVDALHGWLTRRVAQPVPAAMSAAARQRALEHFSMPVFAQRTADFYRYVRSLAA